MTAKEREQVAELLRCAARNGRGIARAAVEIYGDQSIIGAAIASEAIEARFAAGRDDESLDYDETCRIAAARVEECSWP